MSNIGLEIDFFSLSFSARRRWIKDAIWMVQKGMFLMCTVMIRGGGGKVASNYGNKFRSGRWDDDTIFLIKFSAFFIVGWPRFEPRSPFIREAVH